MANRQQWIVQQVTDDGTVYAREVGNKDKHQRTVTLPSEYVSEWAHLSYATTAYGVQGATVNRSHTMLSEATSAAGVYVGMTRGRKMNRLHIVAENLADARAQFIEAMERDPADRGLDHATQQAIQAVQGLIKDGPVQLVTDELAHLITEAERAERVAERWEQTAARFDAQRTTHKAEDDEHADLLRRAEGEATRIRTQVAEPLIAQAKADGTTYLTAVEREAAASGRLATAGRFGKRKARIEHRQATEHTRTIRAQVRQTWGEPPRDASTLHQWTARQAERHADADPRMIDATQQVTAARTGGGKLRQRHERERLALLVSEYGAEQARRIQLGMRAPNPKQEAAKAQRRADAMRGRIEELRGLPIHEAAARIREQQDAERQAEARRAQQTPEPYRPDDRRHEPHTSPRLNL